MKNLVQEMEEFNEEFLQIKQKDPVEGMCIAHGWLQEAQLSENEKVIAVYQRILENAISRYKKSLK